MWGVRGFRARWERSLILGFIGVFVAVFGLVLCCVLDGLRCFFFVRVVGLLFFLSLFFRFIVCGMGLF